ncbi:osmoregulated periplasmic glucans (OPGs) biosynthesis protein G [Hyphomicrobiales bacterium]|nr:osmoregulated periplasmic glucans (OPGs) biosynthesis protein G [Hyphomicrobiales bacterium]CAH1697830.1 osmoregulated periplasmic glucans (OPGs) biosynthesis protein G [Hyphomicrobiales bacterium]CAI0347476.1 osmoregulated periplasmic glucans (OPGs) biosynthesis protein G [Hyphomicrobiales bacterium]
MYLSTRSADGALNMAQPSSTRRAPAPLRRQETGRKRRFAGQVAAFGWLIAGMLLLGTSAFAQARKAGFGLDDVIAKAKTLADAPYVAPASNLPDVFSKMQFADYQKMQPRRDRFAWTEFDTPFKLAFYHQGMQFNTPVKINEIVNGAVQEIPYDAGRFDFGDLHFDRSETAKLGWAGFRVVYPVNQAGKLDEIMSVLGASYFRVIGKGQIYGLSGRGLAIDSGLPIAEEFPAFREFWLRRPKPQERRLTFYALMNAPRATGAYEFTLIPGNETVLQVKARVFLRQGTAPTTLGIAPLTSMFLYGPNQPWPTHNFRPAIHDSNGLAVRAGDGEWIWRPLNNPPMVTTSNFTTENPKGFGLLQRGRAFSRYEDLKDRYDLRPSAWIEPTNDWGKGAVRLIEIPTADETNDNIVAFWVPESTPPSGQPMRFDYRIRWTMDEPSILNDGTSHVWQTLRATGEIYQSNLIRAGDGTLAFLIDFKGPSLRKLSPQAQVTATVGANDNVEIVGTELQPNPAIQGWRLTYRVKVKNPNVSSDLHAALTLGNRRLTETWKYNLPPAPLPKDKESYLNHFKAIE